VLTRITAAIFVIEMVGATLSLVISRLCRRTNTQTGCNINEFAVNGNIHKSLIDRPKKISIGWDVLKREVFPVGKHIIQNYNDQVM
jgi:hypothetical protein